MTKYNEKIQNEMFEDLSNMSKCDDLFAIVKI